MYILFNFINRTDRSDVSVVLFQKNVSSSADGTAIAYKLIKNPLPDEVRAFSFPVIMQISATDTDGYLTPYAPVENGNVLLLQRVASADSLYVSVGKGNPNEILLYNLLANSPANVFLYRDYQLLARQNTVKPRDTAVFEITPTLWVGVSDHAVEGGVMDKLMLSDFKTELPLTGLKSADIVMTDQNGKFSFALENVVTG